MPRHYLVDGYNLILQDEWLDDLLHQEGLGAARHALLEEAERFARRTDCRVRLVFDGAAGPMEHDDRFDNEWVDATFTSRDEKADERLVAVASECRRRGVDAVIVSDDREGIRRPLEERGFPVMGTRDFVRLLRPSPPREEVRESALSGEEKRRLAETFLLRDAEARKIRRGAPPPIAAAPTLPAPPAGARPPAPKAAVRPSPPPLEVAVLRAEIERRKAAKKARGLRKQARRLARSRPNRTAK